MIDFDSFESVAAHELGHLFIATNMHFKVISMNLTNLKEATTGIDYGIFNDLYDKLYLCKKLSEGERSNIETEKFINRLFCVVFAGPYNAFLLQGLHQDSSLSTILAAYPEDRADYLCLNHLLTNYNQELQRTPLQQTLEAVKNQLDLFLPTTKMMIQLMRNSSERDYSSDDLNSLLSDCRLYLS
jgi:hypothetical protein